MTLDLKACLAQSSLFNQLDATALDELHAAFEYRHLSRGETLFRRGEVGDAFYFLASGRLQIIKDSVVGELMPGDTFGELALIGEQTRAATIVAARDSELGRLPKQQFQQLLKNHQSIALELIKLLGEHLNQQQSGKESHSCTVVTLVTLSAHPSVKSLPQALSQLLLSDTRTCHIDPEQLNQQLWSGADEMLEQGSNRHSEQLSRWLSEQEQHSDYILLQTCDTPSAWRDFCLNQSDKTLYLTDDSASSLALPIHSDKAVESELVFLHESSAISPVNTHKRLQSCQVKRHHHIRQGSEADIRRLAREIKGQALALVLGGGGARSFAHIGVLKAMEELNIPIDRIAGTSMGAILGAQYADGYSPDQMLALNEEIWVRQKPHKDFTLPISSLLSANRARQYTKGVFGERHIEDLWLDFFCVSTDLTELKPYHHRKGLVWPALLASGAIPGVCSSIVSDEGSLLVDGGILDNLPVAAMRAHHKGPIIAVDISSDKGLKPSVTDTIPPNGWQALWHYLNPFNRKRRFPHIFKLISHTATLTGKVNAQASRQLADLCLTPDCQGHGLMEMKRLDELVEYGYQEAMPKLQQWLEPGDQVKRPEQAGI